jgi:pimeloyl-ACP methyl ester carboxylesterase
LSPAFRAWDITEAWAGIDVPVLAIQGMADPYGTAAQVVALQAAAGRHVRPLLLEELGRALHLEAAETVLAAVARLAAEVFPRIAS